MKKLFSLLFVIVAAMVTFLGCVKEEISSPASENKTVQFIAQSIETKTAFGTPDGTTYPTLWTVNDEKVKLSLNLASPSDVAITPSGDFKTAKFEAAINDDESGSYTFYSLSPAKAFNSFHAANKYLSAAIPTSQTPLENSVDEAAQILYAISDTYPEMPSSVSLDFQHFTAYGKLSFRNLELGEANVTSVAVTSSVDFAGRWNYNVETGTFTENSGASTITLLTTKTEGLWFACAPVDMDGQTLTFTVNTDQGPLSKTVTLSGKKFDAGKIALMTVDMSGVTFAEPKVYELVTDVISLTEGSEIIIVAAESDYALSTTQNSNNRGQAAVTKSEDVIKDPGSDVQVLTIEPGNVENTYAFNTGSGYLYAASSSSNYLKTEATLSANSSWAITIEDGVATITAQGESTRKIMQHNSSSSLFACYGSASQKALSIYKLQGSGTVLENYLKVSPASIEVDADATSASFTVSSDLTWTVTPSENAEVASEGTTVNVTFEANTENEEKTYTIVVSADGVESKTVTITQAAYVDPAVIEELTIAEFLEKSASDAVWYKLTGIVSDIYNTTYGNFYLNDGETSVQVYGLTATKVDSNDKSFSSLNIKDGDELILIGTRADYNGTAQVGGPAYYVSHVPAPYLEVSSTTLNVAADATTVEFTVDANVDWSVSCTADATATKTDNNVVVTFAANETEDAKVYEVTITSELGDETVTITQAAVSNGEVGEEVTVTKTIADIADFNSWVNSTKYASFPLDGIVTATAKGGSNTGKYYTSGEGWRLYQTESPTLTISAIDGYMIKSVKITYSVSNTGVLTYSGSNIVSGTVVNVNESSITFGVGNTGTATNGQVRVTAIEVVYQAN